MRLAILLALAVFAAAVSVSARVACYDNGGISITGYSDLPNVVNATKEGSSKRIQIPGEWNSATGSRLHHFVSDEAILVNANSTTYMVYAGPDKFSVTCPPFVFSCRIINVTASSCYKQNNTFIARFNAYNYKLPSGQGLRFERPFLLTYKVVDAQRRELKHSPDVNDPEFRNISLSVVRNLGYNTFALRWNTTRNISKFIVQYQECGDRYNFFESVQCSARQSCIADRECGADESCQAGECAKLDCGECSRIVDRKCVKLECCSDDDCAEGKYCASSYCLALACLEDEVVNGHECVSLDCGAGEFVLNRTCTKCPAGQRLEAGSCAPLQCTADERPVADRCEKLSCADDEAFEKHQCVKLRCGFLQAAHNHACMSIFRKLFGG